MVVFVLDKHGTPLMPCSEKRARLLLQRHRAVVHRLAPFTIRLKDRTRTASRCQPLRLKIDPGACITGMAVLQEPVGQPETPQANNEATVMWLAELHHKTDVKEKLDKRRSLRRSRRNRKCRYRPPRFRNRRRPQGWLPPSLTVQVEQTVNAVKKLNNFLPLTALSVEHAKFDTQLLQDSTIQGIDYQHGTLWGYELKEYLLEKFQHHCAYCHGASGDPVLEVEHILPKQPQHGPTGTDRVSNLVIACRTCNRAKGNCQPQEWLQHLHASPEALDRIRAHLIPQVLYQLQEPLRAPTWLNATRWRLYERLLSLGLPIDCGTGAQTKRRRIALGLPKSHVFDAACVGATTPSILYIETAYVNVWQAIGRGRRQMAKVNKTGFPISHKLPHKHVHGFQTGDLVLATVPRGTYQGVWRGRVAIRQSGFFDLKDHTNTRVCQGISYTYCRLLQRADGWYYTQRPVYHRPTGETAHSSLS